MVDSDRVGRLLLLLLPLFLKFSFPAPVLVTIVDIIVLMGRPSKILDSIWTNQRKKEQHSASLSRISLNEGVCVCVSHVVARRRLLEEENIRLFLLPAVVTVAYCLIPTTQKCGWL